MAMGLMAKHGIEQSAIGGERPSARVATKVERTIDPYEAQLACAAAELYGCTCLFWRAGKSGFAFVGRPGFAFVGRPDNTDAAEQTHLWLVSQVDRLYKAALRPGMTQRDRAEFRRTFKIACASRVRRRAIDLVANPLQIATDIKSTALVVGDYFEKLKAENAVVLQEMVTKKARASRTRWGSGSDLGYAAGDRVKLRREVH
jgi:hypothetical protein